MASSVDQQSAEKPGRYPACKVRPTTRAKPRLEVLETRCLLSGSRAAIGLYGLTAHAIRTPSPPSQRIAGHATRSSASIPVAPRALSVSEPAAPSGYDNSSPGTPGSTRFQPSSVGIPGLTGASYTVVLETKAPHHTVATAQVLPDLSFFGVVGTLSTSDTIDLYRLTLNEKAEELNFGLAFQSDGSFVPIDFQIFNGTGQLLGEWSSGDAGASALVAQLGPQAAGSTFYLGISTGNQGALAASSAGVNYQLWVSRESATDQSAASPQDSPTVPTASASASSAGALTPLAAMGTAPARGLPAATATAPPDSSGGTAIAVAVGSPAMQTGRPSVEASSSGDSDLLAQRDVAAATDQGMDEQRLSAAIETRQASDPGSRLESNPDADALVAMNGPGGFALLGAVALGHRPTNRAPIATEADVAASQPAQVPALEIAAGDIAPTSNMVLTAEKTSIEEGSIGARLWDRLPDSLFSGLGLAFAFTLNATLSQPFAGFDFIASRFDAIRGNRRRRKGKAETRSRERAKRTAPDDSPSDCSAHETFVNGGFHPRRAGCGRRAWPPSGAQPSPTAPG